ASEANQETPWSSLAVLRTAPLRHFVPLPQQAGGEIQRGQSDVSPVERQRNGARTMTPKGLLPRGAEAERGSTAEGGEGARAKRAMRHPGVSQRSCGPRPLGTSCHSPSKLGEKSKEASRTSPPWSGSRTGDSMVTPPWSGSGTGEYRRRRGGGASEASQETPWSSPAVLRTAPPRHFVPLPQQAGGEIQRGQSDVSPVERQRQGALTMTSQGLLPRGAAAERGSTAESREGARAKRARKPPCGPG